MSEIKTKEVKEQSFINQCTSQHDIYLNSYRESHNLIVIKIKDDLYLCLTREELKQIIQKEPHYHLKNAPDTIENRYYKLFYIMRFVNHTLKDLYDARVNTMQAYPIGKRKIQNFLYGEHADTEMLEVKEIKRCDLYNNKNCTESDTFDLEGGESEVIEEAGPSEAELEESKKSEKK